MLGDPDSDSDSEPIDAFPSALLSGFELYFSHMMDYCAKMTITFTPSDPNEDKPCMCV